MATYNPTFLAAYNSGAQNLYSINEPFTRVPQLVGSTEPVTVTFDTEVEASGLQGSLVGSTGLITLEGDGTVVFWLNFMAQTYAPTTFKLVDVATGDQQGLSGTRLSVTLKPASTTTYAVQAFSDQDAGFVYPNQITNASITVQAVSGWTE